MKETEIEKLRQLISRTDMSGNEKVNWLVQFITDFASQSKPVTSIVNKCDSEPTIKSVTNCPTCGSECEIGSGDSGSHYYIPNRIKPVDTKTVDAVEFLHWVRENDFIYSGGAGWYKDEFDIVIVNALTYITDAELLNLYKQDIESKK